MSIINLKIIYPDYYNEDLMLEVSEQIAKVLEQSLSDEKVFRRKCRRNGVTCFFDSCDERYVAARSNVYATLEETLDHQLEKQQLYTAINLLPPTQARRIYAHYILGMTKLEISEFEGVDESAIRRSLLLAEKNLKEILKNF